MNKGSIFVFALALAAATFQAAGQSAEERVKAFETDLVRAQRDSGAITADGLTKILVQAKELGRPQAAAMATKTFLSNRSSVPPGLIRLAAENASLYGDYRTAVARYKQYLKVAPQGPEASEAAAALYTIMVDYTGAGTDAFQFMDEYGDKLRDHVSSRKFDAWFLQSAREKRASTSAARRLALIFAGDKLPLEQERLLYWDYLDWLMYEISQARPDQYPALSFCKQIAASVRENPYRTAKLNFLTAHLEFKAASAGKEEAVLDKEFAAVIAAARAYFETAPNAEGLKDIMKAFAGGFDQWNEGEWNRFSNQKRDLFVASFPRLSDPDKEAMMGWTWASMHHRLATPEQWVDLGAQFPDLFKRSAMTAALPFIPVTTNRELYKKMSPFLQGVQSQQAAVINAMAAGGDDLWACVQNLVQRESWYLTGTDLHALFYNQMCPAFNGYPRDDAHKLPPKYMEGIQQRFGTEVVFRSPIAIFHPDSVRDHVLMAWRNNAGDPNDKTGFIASAHLLDWVPYTEEQRKSIFAPAYDEFKRWADEVRKSLETNKDGADAKAALITAIENGFKEVMSPQIVDPGKGPDALCQNMARLMVALQAKDAAAYTAAAKTVYSLVREYPAKKTPFGEMCLIAAVQNRVEVESIDAQCEFLADQLSMLDPKAGSRSLSTTMHWMMHVRPDWGWGAIPSRDKDRAIKMNNVLAKALLSMCDRNQFSPDVFEWFRHTRRGRDWQDNAVNAEVLTKMIEKNILAESPWRPWGPSTAANYCYLVRNDFQSLAGKFPPESFFDDMYAVESTKSAYIDTTFWAYSPDREKKGYDTAARMMGGYSKLPLGYDGAKAVYSPAQFWDIQWRVVNNAQDAVRNEMLAKIEATFGQSRFDEYAMGRLSFRFIADYAGPEKRKAFFDKLNAYTEKAANAPVRVNPPLFGQLEKLGGAADLSPVELDSLARVLSQCAASPWPGGYYFETVAALVHEGMVAQKRTGELFPLVPTIWKIARDTGNVGFQRQVAQYAGALMEAGEFALAAAYSSSGMDILGGGAAEDIRNTLLAVRSKSAGKSGGVIPVDRSDRRYPIFAAQADYLVGKLDNAWETYLGRRDLLLSEFKELDPAFSTWIVEKHTQVGNYEEAEALAQKLIQWIESAPQGFDPEARAHLLVSYADIAFTRQEFPRSRAQYERIVVAKEFDGTQSKKEAELKIAEVDRLTKNFDRATEQLEKLARRKDPFLQAEASYQLALIKYDLEEYQEAKNCLDQVFAIDLHHANANILQGKLYLKMKKLVEATDVKAGGLQANQQTIIPGKALKVQLQDRNLAVVGKSADIEVRVWTKSGDEEFFRLLPFGDSKTKFEGQVTTTMGKTEKGDRVLQVLGSDIVYYDFSDRFKRANKIAEAKPISITVVSDAELYVSSGKILTREQQEQKALETMIRERARMEIQATGMALSTLRADNEIKPGNQINVRLIDADQNTSTNKNIVKLRVTSSSGDVIEGFSVQETTPYSGVFEGEIPTISAPATAFASDSEEGKDANQVISSGSYQGWAGLPDNVRPKWFGVDLNTSVQAGKMSILADIPGRHLKKFILQTSMNGREFSNVGAWPDQLKAWDGTLKLELVRYAGVNGAPNSLAEFRQYLDVGCVAQGAPKVEVPPTFSVNWDGNVAGMAGPLGLQGNGVDSWYIAHLYGAFYVTKRQVKTFTLDPKGRLDAIRYFVTVDGQLSKNPSTPYEVSGSLGKGVHRLDVYMCAQRNANPSFEITSDTPQPPYKEVCKIEAFDPAKRPEISAVRFQPASITTNTAGTTFEVSFASNTSARVIRMWLLDFETDAPAIKKLTLHDTAGQQVLPSKQDLMALKKNRTLEIIPGDKISISYDDPKCISKEKQVSEASMTATFHDATLSACFIESTLDASGNRSGRYIPMRRFKPGDAINIFVADPDGDISDARDKIKISGSSSSSKAIAIEALETEIHSGVFVGKVFPVAGAPTRPSELTVTENDDVILSYMDQENTDPGIPWRRTYLVEQTSERAPELRVYDVASRLLNTNELAAIVDPTSSRQYEELVPVTRSLTATRPLEPNRETPASGIFGVPLIAELTYPTIVQSPLSRASIYVQTEASRAKSGKQPGDAFDPKVPGTIRVEVSPCDLRPVTPPQGYSDVALRGNPYAAHPLDDGRFTFIVPLKLGKIPEKSTSFSFSDTGYLLGGVGESYFASVRGGDKVYVGFPFPDGKGSTNWATQVMTIKSDIFFDIMDSRYQQNLQGTHVGESVYLRVIDAAMDTTDEKDTVAVKIESASTNRVLTLTETFAHSGTFKGVCRLVFVGDKSRTDDLGALPVKYGDSVAASYMKEKRSVLVYKGADGDVLPFTKRFKDPDIAVQTQFTVAEAYFEMAKKHRELAQESLARREIAQGKKLLDEAIRDYPNTEARAQADYLLAELSLEFANEAVNEDEKKKHYTEAISRFSDIVATYPDSPHAPKAQYKKALVFEKMGDIDLACEEYVKLSYRYPDNELVAETIARLGQYFLAKGKGLLDKANAQTDQVEKEKLRIQARDMNRTAAQVFGRLSQRFPDHRLAAKTLVLSAQCYMRADDLPKAIDVFKKIIEDKKAESDLIAQSMYWCADCHMKQGDHVNAYRMFKKVTWDYPESTWAKYARGRLTETTMVSVENADVSQEK